MSRQPKIASFHEDVFYAFFEPYKHPDSSSDIWGGLGLGTFGKDFELVLRAEPDHVWTVIDGDDGSQWIVPGIHLVNRVCYLVTSRSHGWVETEFRLSSSCSTLTSAGLARQSKRLRLAIESECGAQ